MQFQRSITRLQDLDDIISAPASGSVLVFDGNNYNQIQLNLNALMDVLIDNPSNSDALIFSGPQNKWVNNKVLDGGSY